MNCGSNTLCSNVKRIAVKANCVLDECCDVRVKYSDKTKVEFDSCKGNYTPFKFEGTETPTMKISMLLVCFLILHLRITKELV